MFGKQEIKAFLDEKGLQYEWIEHEAVYTIEDMVRLGLEENKDVAKNLFLRDQKGKHHFLVVIRADKQANLKELGEKLGIGKLSFASEERLEKYMGLKKGAVTPLGVLNDENHVVEVVFDKDLTHAPKVGIHPNDNTATVWMSFKDLKKLIEKLGNPISYAKF